MEKIMSRNGVEICLHSEDLKKHNGFVYIAASGTYYIVINSTIEDNLRKEMIDQQCQYILQNRPSEFYGL